MSLSGRRSTSSSSARIWRSIIGDISREDISVKTHWLRTTCGRAAKSDEQSRARMRCNFRSENPEHRQSALQAFLSR